MGTERAWAATMGHNNEWSQLGAWGPRWARQLLLIAARRRHWLLRYGLAAVVTVLFITLDVVLAPVVVPQVFLLLFPAVVISSWFGGFGPGLFSGILGSLAVDVLFLPPVGMLEVRVEDAVPLLVFVGVSALIAAGMEGYRNALDALRESYSRESEQRLAAQRLAAIVETSSDSILAKDLDGTITSWNPASERMYGYSVEEAVGRNVAMLVPAEIENEVPRYLERLRREERVENFETVRITRDGRRLQVSMTISPLSDVHGQVIGASTICRDVTAQKQAEEALHRSRERFRVAQDLSLDGFTILDAVRDDAGRIMDFELTYVNPAAGQMLQYSPEYLAGRRLLDVMPGNAGNSDLFSRYVRVVETGEPHDDELYYESERIQGWFRNMAVKLEDGLAVSFRDITVHREVEQQREELLHKAEQAARAREDVLAVVSHDLRNPLEVIQLTAQMLKQENVPEEKRREALERQLHAVQQMKNLVGDLLEVSRAEAGHLHLEYEEVDVAHLMHVARELFEDLAREADLTLSVISAGMLPAVLADPRPVLRVLSNLLSNAIKFTPAGGEVCLRADWAPAEVIFSVCDTGPGIPPAARDYMFAPFWQARNDAGGRDGVGLGLAICKTLVEAHGGRIWVESKEMQGTTFYFTLPQVDAGQAPAEP